MKRPSEGKVLSWIRSSLPRGPLHMTLVDPAPKTKLSGDEAAKIASDLGTDAIMVGGSTGVTGENLDRLVASIKRRTNLPTIYFPSNSSAFTPLLDAVYFLSTLNSRNPRFIVREQARGAPFLCDLGVECISLGYLIVDPGMRVGEVSEADLIPRTKEGESVAVGYALAAELFGMDLVYLEAGSGAPTPVPPSMVRTVRSKISIPLVVGGGIRSRKDAREILNAGADVLVTGTVAEEGDFSTLGEIISEVRSRRKPL